jgi:CubicO group peptidase (beta-lactamase class C family)
MNIMKTLIFCSFLLFAAQGFALTGTNIPDSAVWKIDSTVNALMKKKNITGASVAVVDNGRMAFHKGYGFSDKARNIQTSVNTVFGIGSITKTFTALAIMKLHDDGKIDLDKPASFYLPDLKIKSIAESGDILKIKNLLSHTSGLADGVMMLDSGCKGSHDFHDIIADMNQEVVVHKTNWKWSYCNLGFDLLGCVIERVTGMKYEDYMRINFLEKMDMAHSGFDYHPQDTLYSKGYLGKNKETAEKFIGDAPAGRIFSNVEDMGHFMLMILNHGMYNGKQIISKQSLMAMETSHITDVVLPGTTYGYAMFIEKMRYKEDSLIGEGVGHGGDTYVFHATCFMFPKSNMGIVILANSQQGSSFCNTALLRIFATWQKRVKGIKLHPQEPVAADSVKNKSKWVGAAEIPGNYSTEDQTLIIKRVNDNKLMLVQDKQHIVLKKQKDDRYTVTLRLLGFIPIPLKDVFMGFEKIGGNTYMTQTNGKNGKANYVSVKQIATPVPDAWKKTAGKYKVLNPCMGNFYGTPEKIVIKDDKILMTLRMDKKETETCYFSAINDTFAALDGIDRPSGAVMKLLPNGHIYFSGYEMVKE